MAVGLFFNGVGVTQEQYQQVFNQVTNNGTTREPGMLTHHAGPSADGFCVIETWASQEALEHFFRDKLGQALAAANISVQPTTFEVSNTF
jgi:quinol monooxygenase YgiN